MIAVATHCALLVLSCSEPYTGPFKNPNAPNIPSFADSAFGSGITWFRSRTFESVTAAAIDAQSAYQVEFSAATGHSFVALAINNGALRWAKAVPGATDIVSVGGTAAAVSTVVSAFGATTGDVKFTYTPVAARLVSSNGATNGVRIYVGNLNGEVVALDTMTGAESWKTQIDSRPDSMAVKGVSVSGNTVFAGGDGYLAALDATTGALKWKRLTTETPRPFVAGAPGVDSGRVTVLSFKSGAYGIVNYDATSGAMQWNVGGATGTASAELLRLPACDGKVFAEDGSPGLAALNTTTGSSAWARSLNVYSSLTVACSNGSVITNGLTGAAGSLRNEVQVLKTTDGSVVALYPKVSGQVIRIYRVLRNATTLYFFTDKGVTVLPAP